MFGYLAMSRSGVSYGRALALMAGIMAWTVGSPGTVGGASAEAPGQRANARVARTAAAPWCWKRIYGSSCRTSAHQARKAQKKSDPRPTLMIGIGF